MKLNLNKKKVFYIILICIVIALKAPSFINNVKNQGLIIDDIEKINLKNKAVVIFPNKDAIVVFWASYCAPCKVEMGRLNDSVISGKIDKTRLFAINPFEDSQTIAQFVDKSQLHFQFIDDNKLSNDLNIAITPTTLFIKDNRIKSINTGLSIIGIWLAEFFY